MFSYNGEYRTETHKGDKRGEYLLFMVDETVWAISTSFVEQTFYLDNLTPIPLMPSAVIGLTNLSGEAVPVFNLSVLNNSPIIQERLKGKRCIVIKQAETRVALLTSDIFSIISIDENLMTKEDGVISLKSFIHDEQFTLLLDVDKLFLKIRAVIRDHHKKDSAAISANW